MTQDVFTPDGGQRAESSWPGTTPACRHRDMIHRYENEFVAITGMVGNTGINSVWPLLPVLGAIVLRAIRRPARDLERALVISDR